MAINDVSILGSGQTRFGELWEESVESMAKQASYEALEEAELKLGDIDAIVVGNMLLSVLENRSQVGRVVADALRFGGPAYHEEAACASGGMAVATGVSMIRAGTYKRVLIVGVEKMTDVPVEIISRSLMGAGSEMEQLAGATFPSLYGMITRLYMNTYGVSDIQLAAQAVLAHDHAFLNPLAQFHQKITAEEVLNSPMVADPIRLLNASPVSDGAAAVILGNDQENARVYITGSAVGGDFLGLHERDELLTFNSTQRAMSRAYNEANITSDRVEIAEVHDCFSVAQAIGIEDLGICPKGKGAEWITAGNGKINDEHVVINPSGGLKGCGHPVGATGVKQIVEIYRQMLDRCGKRQVAHTSIGVTQNVGGSGATAVVHVLKHKGKVVGGNKNAK